MYFLSGCVDTDITSSGAIIRYTTPNSYTDTERFTDMCFDPAQLRYVSKKSALYALVVGFACLAVVFAISKG